MKLIRLSNEFIGPAVAYVSNRLLNFVSRVMKTSRNAAFKSDAPPHKIFVTSRHQNMNKLLHSPNQQL